MCSCYQEGRRELHDSRGVGELDVLLHEPAHVEERQLQRPRRGTEDDNGASLLDHLQVSLKPVTYEDVQT